MNKNLLKTAFAILLIIAVNQIIAQPARLFVRDILDNPQKYYNLQVQLTGEVTKVINATSADTRGYYYIIDNSDKTIKVVANTLPAPNTKVTLVGIVQMETEAQQPFVREVTRIDTGTTTSVTPDTKPGRQEVTQTPKEEGMNPVIILLIVLIVGIVIALVFVVVRKPSGATQARQPAPPPTAEEPTPAAPVKTKQVSIDEVNRQVGGIKTKQVPNILAEVKISTGPMSGKSFPLGYETTIGRISGDVILEDASVSRKHAKIVFTDNQYVLHNLSDVNPVILNGERVTASKEVKDGDEIVLGVVKLVFKLI